MFFANPGLLSRLSTASLIVAVFLILIDPTASAGEGPKVGESSIKRGFSLPEQLDNYADPDLPRHFQSGTVRGLENTPRDNPITNAGATLGRVLFYEKRLSGDRSMSCASCHVQKQAFSHPDRFSKGIDGRLGDRNAMGLSNARYYPNGRFFWDERASTLEIQVLAPIENPIEMAHALDSAVATIATDPAYGELFRKAFGDSAVTRDRLAKALAQFIRSMVSYRSKYDEGMAKSRSISDAFANFSERENRGKAIFLGDHDPASRGNCASCHLSRFDFRAAYEDRAAQQAIFLPDRPFNNGLDAEFVGVDNGLGDRTLNPRDYGRFKSPDLRNVELTAPYMHDGRFDTLEAVVEHYNLGVKAHPNLDPQLRIGRGRPGPRNMRLDPADKAALVSFLKTLTDWKLVEDPRFSDPFSKIEKADSGSR